MPNYIDVSMAIGLVFFRLVGLGSVIIMIMFRTAVFLISFFVVMSVISIIILFLSCDNFPFHFEGALTEHLVLSVCQVYANLASIENVIVSGRRPYSSTISISIRIICLFDYVGVSIVRGCRVYIDSRRIFRGSGLSGCRG